MLPVLGDSGEVNNKDSWQVLSDVPGEKLPGKYSYIVRINEINLY